MKSRLLQILFCLYLPALCQGQGVKRPVPKANPGTWVDSNEMVHITGGTFAMGSESGELDEKPVHKVTLSNYSIGRYEVTQQQWESIMGSNPSAHTDCANCPVENVSWEDIETFLWQLNAKFKGHHYRLPTEAEWEYAARGGNKSKNINWSGAATQDELKDHAWFYLNSGSSSHPVGTKQPNELGIFDMSGNIWEWCFDGFADYGNAPENNPTGAATVATRVYRGGGWGNKAAFCRITRRNGNAPAFRYSYLGFRLASTP